MTKNRSPAARNFWSGGRNVELRRIRVPAGRATIPDFSWPSDLSTTSTKRQLGLLLCCRDCPLADRVQTYARRLATLLDGELRYPPEDDEAAGSFKTVARAAGRYCDLVVLGEPRQSLLKRLFFGPLCHKAAERLPNSVLIARQPRWPLRRLLLITRSHTIDEASVEWTRRLAEASGAEVRMLAVTPPLPPICSEAIFRMDKVIDWRMTDTPLGRQARRLADTLGGGYSDLIHFRPGTPTWQIRSELKEGNYDLVIIAADPKDWWSRRLLGTLVESVLDLAEQPVLVARMLSP